MREALRLAGAPVDSGCGLVGACLHQCSPDQPGGRRCGHCSGLRSCHFSAEDTVAEVGSFRGVHVRGPGQEPRRWSGFLSG